MGKYFLNIVEYCIMNNNWDGWRMARIEVITDHEKYPVYEGFIRLPDKAFEALREELDFKEFDKLPYLNFNYKEDKDGD
jgi:hypothetical protein